jgi:hypothetical protein
LDARLVKVDEALNVFAELYDIVFDLFGDEAILAVALGGTASESMATVADFFQFRDNAEVTGRFVAGFFADLVRGALNKKFEEFRGDLVTFLFHLVDLFDLG